MDDNWNNFLKSKFNVDKLPDRFILDLGEIHFYIPPLLATTPEGFRIIQKHNSKKTIF